MLAPVLPEQGATARRKKGLEMIEDHVHSLNKIAEQVRFLAAELEAGETIDPYDLGMIARRIDAQAEMLAFEGKAES